MNVQEFLTAKLNEMRGRKNNPINSIYCVYELRIDEKTLWTLDLREEGKLISGAANDPDCVLWLNSQTVAEAIDHPEKLWDNADSAGLRTSNRLRAAQLLEALWPGMIAKSAQPELVSELFPQPAAGLSTNTTEFFNKELPSRLRKNPRMFGFINAEYQFDFSGAGTWSLDLSGTPEVRKGPAKSPKCVSSMSAENFDQLLAHPDAVWPMFQDGRIRATNVCRATQFFNGIFPGTLQRSMPPALYHSLFPNPSLAPSAPEYNKGNGPKTGYVMGANGPVAIPYADIDGEAIYQGDIRLGTVAEMERIAAAVEKGVKKFEDFQVEGFRILGWSPTAYLWPNGIVYYNNTYDSDKIPQELNDAMSNWKTNTRITFEQRTNQVNYITVKKGTGCSSSVGMIGGEQIITLEKNCGTGAIIHEIGHAVGLFHEHTRYDRDKNVTIKYDNIIDNMKYNFNIPGVGLGLDLGNYDFGSIMHYDAYAFSKNNKKTIETSQSIGQRNGLSAGDISAIASMYGAKGLRKTA